MTVGVGRRNWCIKGDCYRDSDGGGGDGGRAAGDDGRVACDDGRGDDDATWRIPLKKKKKRYSRLVKVYGSGMIDYL